jgi:hypothetical protein
MIETTTHCRKCHQLIIVREILDDGMPYGEFVGKGQLCILCSFAKEEGPATSPR